MQRRHDFLGPGHLRHELRVDEARRLDALQPGSSEPVAKVGADGRLQQAVLVLEAIPRTDVADDHIDKGRTASECSPPFLYEALADVGRVDVLVEATSQVEAVVGDGGKASPAV